MSDDPMERMAAAQHGDRPMADEPTERLDEPFIALRPDDPDDDPVDIETLQDDIVVTDVSMFRAEQMDTNNWWVCCYLPNDERITFDVRAKGRPVRLEWTVVEVPQSGRYEHEGHKR